MPQWVTPQVPLLRNLCPDYKLIFNTRHPSPSIASFLKITDFLKVTAYFKLGLSWRVLREVFALPYGIKKYV